MDPNRFFPPATRRALAYEPPGSWMPPLPEGCIRLSAGYPFPESVPTGALVQAASVLVAAERDLPFHYLGSPSMDELAELIGVRCRERGMPVGSGELLITSGITYGLDLVARALLGPEDLVAVEAPTYMEALEIFRNCTPHIVGYPVDAEGLQVEALAEDLAARKAAGRPLPKLVYTVASFQNPTGATLSPDRRRRLLELAEQYDLLILEDDAYGELAFGEPPVPLKALDESGRVIHAGSLSKVVAPGLRVGWLLADRRVIRAVSTFKKDIEHPLAYGIMARYLASIDLQVRIAGLRREYRRRRDILLNALQTQMPPEVTWTRPEGGYFVWVHTPGVDTAALLPRAAEAGVAYVPGKYFFFDGERGREYLRLSFSYLSPAEMERGVVRLAQVLRNQF